MKLTDFKEVEKLYSQLKKINDALTRVQSWDSVSGDEYWCYLNKHRDGSGFSVDMTGCDVMSEMVKATNTVLSKKRMEVEALLTDLGVTIDG